MPLLHSEEGAGTVSDHFFPLSPGVSLAVSDSSCLPVIALDVPRDFRRRLNAHVDVAKRLKEVCQVVEVGS